ncbi:glycerol-3-phosphate dehydrogenase [Povalibacter sp.]|uniref:glycerol-3-phosphate dehydrogenase n=1 Tax=Povalibacter sp. TaxID=1962978 RepID=UPI002F409839
MSDPFDLLIVGGGINGTGIARDAAGRGHKVMLIEQSDLASATSSASTKLIHGGLRYLELFEFRLVREALIERERLLAIAPHIIRPMQFVLPHVEGLRPRWQIRSGLFLYDHIGGRHRLPASHSVSLTTGPWAGSLHPLLTHGFTYSDCWVDDSRLVILNAMDAAQRGATIRTRTRFVGASAQDGHWRIRVEDTVTGEQSVLTARAMVNAAGPWVEDVLGHVPRSSNENQIRLVKGSHIVVPRMYEGDHAFLLQHPDGRVVFAIPYQQDFTLVGTTDVPYEGNPAEAAISTEEIAYLCKTANEYFQRPISPSDVKWTFAGVRPLSDDEASNASKVTRDYKLELTEAQGQPALLSVFGGKITTYRRLAETALHKLHPFIGGSKQGWTDQAQLPGGDLPQADFAAFLESVQRRWSFLPAALAERLARSYGTRISEIVGGAKALEDLGTDFGAGLTRAEVDYLRTHEWARTSEDVLWRRTKIGLHMTAAARKDFANFMHR